MKSSAPYFLYNQEFWNTYSVPMKKHWVNPNCQNSEPRKRTVSILALVVLKAQKIESHDKFHTLKLETTQPN